MKKLLCVLLLAIGLCSVLANFESCTEVANCSESIKNKCDDMSKSLQSVDESRRLVLGCKNGMCMCNLEFVETIAKPTSDIEEKESEKGKENEEPKETEKENIEDS